MNKKIIMELSLDEASAIARFCLRKGQPPVQVLLNACGVSSREPFLFEIEDFVDLRNLATWESIEGRKLERRGEYRAQNKIYLCLLSQLLSRGGERVSELLKKARGTKRRYFSAVKSELEQGRRIPGSDPTWYACTKLNVESKGKIIRDLLQALDFSRSYTCFISNLVMYKRPQIAGLRFKSDDAPAKVS